MCFVALQTLHHYRLEMCMTREPWKITRDMFLSVGEAEALSAHVARQVAIAAESERGSAVVDQIIIETLLYSGLRNTEFCRLTLGDLQLTKERREIHIQGTPREDRVVAISSRLADLLKNYVARVRPHCLPSGTDPRDKGAPLVANERGRPYERTALYRRVVRILTAAGLEDRASVQLLRHTYGYLAYLRTGGNLLFVQKQLGHAHPMVTSVYAEFVEHSPADLADAVDGPRQTPAPIKPHKRMQPEA